MAEGEGEERGLKCISYISRFVRIWLTIGKSPKRQEGSSERRGGKTRRGLAGTRGVKPPASSEQRERVGGRAKDGTGETRRGKKEDGNKEEERPAN